jgi:hypothetical protein
VTSAVGVPVLMLSPLAAQVAGVRPPNLARDRGVPWGALLHTTGRGVVAQAKAEHRTPLEVAVEVYIASQNGSNGYFWGGPHYVIDHDGKSHQLAPENALTAHAGSANRPAYLSGHWEAKCSGAAITQWRRRWPNYRHPYALFPSTSPNHDYVGIEMIPCGPGFGTPMRPGLLFTAAQHDGAAELVREMGARHGWPAGWHKTSRLLGHEDVDLLERMDGLGGWDPGWLRADPYFDFDYVRARV